MTLGTLCNPPVLPHTQPPAPCTRHPPSVPVWATLSSRPPWADTDGRCCVVLCLRAENSAWGLTQDSSVHSCRVGGHSSRWLKCRREDGWLHLRGRASGRAGAADRGAGVGEGLERGSPFHPSPAFLRCSFQASPKRWGTAPSSHRDNQRGPSARPHMSPCLRSQLLFCLPQWLLSQCVPPPPVRARTPGPRTDGSLCGSPRVSARRSGNG